MPSKLKVVLKNTHDKEKHAERMRVARHEWSEEQKQKNREMSKIRMREYRERKKTEREKTNNSEVRKMATRQEKKAKEEQNKRKAEYRKKYRAGLSSQKKRRIREKDAKRKQEKRCKNMIGATTVVQSVPITTENTKTPLSDSALKKAVYRAKKRLPKSPSKFADVVSGLVSNATPRKKLALSNKGLDSSETKKNLDNILQSIKDVDLDMRGRDRESRMKRKSFIGSLSEHVKKRHGMTSTFSAALGIQRKYFSQGCLKEQKKRKDCIAKETEESIQNFFCQDNVSTNLPNKKNIKKDAVECRVIQGSLHSVWNKWKEANPNKAISYDKFTKLKPKVVKTQKHRKYLQCLCEYCENLRLKMVAINKLSQEQKPTLKMKSIQEAVEKTLCPRTGPFHSLKCIDRECVDCGTGKLHADLIAALEEKDQEWKKWALQVSINKRNGKEIKKKELTVSKGKTSELIAEFEKELHFLSKHLFEANWQISQFGILTKNIPPATIALAIDFAENYSCMSQNEVQSAHWSKESVTIHPAVVYYQCPTCPGEVVEECCDIISDDLIHDAHAVNAFLHRIFQHLKTKRGLQVNKAFIMSDGCAAQYKSKIPFCDAANAITEFGFIVQRDFYGSRHGKNRCDGEGGVLKSRVTRAVKNGEAEIVSASDFYTFCRDNLEKDSKDDNGKCLHKRRHLLYVALENIQRPRPERNIRTIPGTQKIHSLVGVEREMVKTRRLSCFCQNCLYGTPENCQQKEYIDQWKPIRLKYLQQPQPAVDVQPMVQPVDVQPMVQPVDVQPMVQPVDVQPMVQPVDVQPMVQPVDVQPMVQPVDVQPMVQPVDVQSMVQPVDVQSMVQPVDVQPMVQPVDVQPMVQPVDFHHELQPHDTMVLAQSVEDIQAQSVHDQTQDSRSERIDCSLDEDDMDISGLTGILDALEEEPEDMALSPILTFMEDAVVAENDCSEEEKAPRLITGHLSIILRSVQRVGLCKTSTIPLFLKTLMVH
ncbi:uncharacterized protein LOC117336235 isoform X2 [Pecten maximus]|uniref:uncharacterized protein LOC117336235 isoform X2 n=1 Tax=Pecten maximus TaxID=6579 RepID=UPI0014586463|nr:uncharacterized protein LOC117336235 isoform X2 [Pecten maximus]